MSESLTEEPSIASLFEFGRLGFIIGHLTAKLVLLNLSLKEVEWLWLRKHGELRVILDLRLVKARIAVLIQDLHGRHASWIAELLDFKLILNPRNLFGCRSIVGIEDKAARQQFVDYWDVDLLVANGHILNVLLCLGWS